MDTNELRIGNYVHLENEIWSDLKGKTMIVEEIKRTHNIGENTDYGISLNEYGKEYKSIEPEYAQFICFLKPIPLTEEWLLKMGFAYIGKMDNTYRLPEGGNEFPHGAKEYRNEKYESILYLDSKYYFITGHSTDEILDDYFTVEINSIHQLQNLYFCLYSTELEIKEQ